MVSFRNLVGLGLASTLMITAPVFASTTPAAKPATQSMAKQAVAPKPAKAAAPKRTASTRHHTHHAKAAPRKAKKVAS